MQMTFQNQLAETAAAVDLLIGQLLPDDGTRLRQAMRYSCLGQGKRLRPFFVAETAKLLSVDTAQALHVGAALECVHCYSLVHDDLPAMDDDDLRRGLPTTHRKFDEATAILAGDALLTFAFEILARVETHPSPETRIKLVRALSIASGEGGMVGGQMLDILAETQNFATLDEISHMQRGKTGALFRFACVASAIMAGADPKPFYQYADHIGLAFQIVDDILDVTSTAKLLGKATQKDGAKGKATFVDFLGLDGAKAAAQNHAEMAKQALSSFGNKAEIMFAAADFVVGRQK